MVDLNKIKQDIKDDIRANGRGEITGQVLQDILLEVVDTEGQIYKETKEELAQLTENVSETKESINVELSKKADATETLQQISAVEETINDNKTNAENQFAEIENRFESTNNFIATVEKNVVDNQAATDEKIARVEESLDAKADPTGNYPKMSVGFADNLIGRGEATAEEFTYRASAGMGRSITDDTARVKKIKGNSVVWNQHLSSTFIEYESTIHLDDGGVPKGHKFALLRSAADGEDNECYYFPSEGIFNYSLGAGEYAKIFTNSHDVDNDYVMVYSVGKSGYVQLVDLTKMFTAGNEPSTIEEFYARIPSGIDTTAYNEGEIINLNTEAIKAVGFNQFNGSYARVIVGETYYLGGTYTNIGFATEIGGVTEGITIPEDKLYKATQDGYIYAEGTDICINLSHTGWKNGTYEPYREFTREIPVIRKYFPDGMKKAGNAFDSIEWDSIKQKWVAVQRIGEVDLGRFEWTAFSFNGHPSFVTRNNNLGAPSQQLYANILCSKYEKANLDLWQKGKDKCIDLNHPYYGGAGTEDFITIRDTDYTDATSFKSAMQGVMLYYELAEPIVTEIEEENINFDYYVEDFGSEEAIASVPSAPFRADVVYTFNAVDTIRNNYLEIEEMKKQMAQMQNAISAMQTAQVKEQE